MAYPPKIQMTTGFRGPVRGAGAQTFLQQWHQLPLTSERRAINAQEQAVFVLRRRRIIK